jgi:hypothetical protein
MWVAYDLLHVSKPVIAFVASPHDEVELLESDYANLKMGPI